MSDIFEFCPECDTPNPKNAEGKPPFTCFHCGHEFRREQMSDIEYAAYKLCFDHLKSKEPILLSEINLLVDRAYKLGKRDAREEMVDREYEELCSSAETPQSSD
jgi:hypothetical protein